MFQLFKSRRLKVFIPETKAKLLLAFEHNGKKYYQFENGFEISAGRGLTAMTFYQEFQMRCDYDYLKLHCKAIDILLKGPKVNIIDVAQIHQNLRERVELAHPLPEHIYKLASVLFFDESESPFAYDMAYNNKKIAEWREDTDMLPFLVAGPLKALMPFSELPKESLKTYFQVTDALAKQSQAYMSAALSKVQ
jgi:hypothetical protein